MMRKKNAAGRFCAAMLVFSGAAAGIPSAAGAGGPGDIKAAGLIQGWFVSDGNPGAPGGFSVRRAEIRLTGQPHPRAGWFLMVDPAKPLNIKTVAQGGTLTAERGARNETTIGADYLIDGHRLKLQANCALRRREGPGAYSGAIRTALQAAF